MYLVNLFLFVVFVSVIVTSLIHSILFFDPERISDRDLACLIGFGIGIVIFTAIFFLDPLSPRIRSFFKNLSGGDKEYETQNPKEWRKTRFWIVVGAASAGYSFMNLSDWEFDKFPCAFIIGTSLFSYGFYHLIFYLKHRLKFRY